MQQLQQERRLAAPHALVRVSPPSDPARSECTVFTSLRRGNEQIWFSIERVASGDRLEAAMIGIWEVLGEAIARRLTKLDVYVSEPEVIPILERQQPAPDELGRWYIQVRSRCNQLGRVRFLRVGTPPTPREPRRRTRRERTLFDATVA